MADDSHRRYEKLPDEALLARFVDDRDEEAFRALVERHAALVLGVCRRALGSPHDAEDALQATFLVLAQMGHRIRRRKSLASWLYGVACRMCARLRREHARHRAVPLEEPVSVQDDPFGKLLVQHEQSATDEELSALPESLRAPMVLRYLSGKSNGEVARELGISVTAVEGRLKRGKQRLRMRLVRRGVTLSTAIVAYEATRVAAEAVPESLIATTVGACTTTTGGTALGPEHVTEVANHLAREEILSMTSLAISKPLTLAATLACVATLAVGLPLALSQPGDQTASGGAGVALSGDAAGTGAIDISGGDQAPPIVFSGSASADDPTTVSGGTTVAADAAASDFFGDVGYGMRPSGAGYGARPRVMGMTGMVAASVAPTEEGIYDLKPRTFVEKKIRTKLQLPADLELIDTPLVEVADILSERHEIPVFLDERTLEDLGIATDQVVTCKFREVSLKNGLRLMLRDLELTYIVRDEVLVITTPEAAESILDARVYPIDRRWNVDPASLLEILTTCIDADSWDEVGGPGSISVYAGGLVVTQTYGVHEKINELLAQLDYYAQAAARASN